MEIGFFLTILIVFAGGAGVGAFAVLLHGNRIKKMRDDMREYERTHKLIETNQRLVKSEQKLKSEIAIKDAEILRFRKAMVTHAEQQKTIKKLTDRVEKLTKQIENQKKAEDARFGHMVKLLGKKGINLSIDELNELQP